MCKHSFRPRRGFTLVKLDDLGRPEALAANTLKAVCPIRVEVTPCDAYLREGGEAACRAKALTRIEGKDYVVQDGDVCYYRVGA